jgi:uncharacterized protein YndB with AHSA1/START domain
MWEYEYTAESEVAPERIWRCWADLASWPSWNPGITAIAVDGPFAVGTGFVMTSPEGDEIGLRIVAIEDGQSFADEMDGGDFQVRTTHRCEPTATGSRLIYRTEITGPAADVVGPQLGPQITADFPDVISALAARAAG